MDESGRALRGDALRERLGGDSALRAYQDLVVGSRSLWTTLGYELAVAWGGLVPGAAGVLLRRLLWPSLLHHCGRGVVWGHGVVLRHPGRMWIGERVAVDDGCFLDAKGCEPGEFRIEDDVLISRDCVISGKESRVHIGARANLGARCALYSSAGLEIGADTLLAAHCYVGGGRYATDGDPERPMSQQPLAARGVSIGPGCWLGAGAVVLDGVRIGAGSMVAAGAVVTHDVAERQIVAGVPAAPIRARR
jgi:acetyltransferase-like isoleucine patch superfamily enzyme